MSCLSPWKVFYSSYPKMCPPYPGMQALHDLFFPNFQCHYLHPLSVYLASLHWPSHCFSNLQDCSHLETFVFQAPASWNHPSFLLSHSCQSSFSSNHLPVRCLWSSSLKSPGRTMQSLHFVCSLSLCEMTMFYGLNLSIPPFMLKS